MENLPELGVMNTGVCLLSLKRDSDEDKERDVVVTLDCGTRVLQESQLKRVHGPGHLEDSTCCILLSIKAHGSIWEVLRRPE